MAYTIMADEEPVDRRVLQGERLVKLETAVTALDRRVADLGERSHVHSSALTTVTLHVEAMSEAVRRIEGKVDATSASIDMKLDANRAAAAAEHATLRSEIAPLRADFFDRRALRNYQKEESADRRQRLALLTGVLSAGLVFALAWVAWRFGFGPQP